MLLQWLQFFFWIAFLIGTSCGESVRSSAFLGVDADEFHNMVRFLKQESVRATGPTGDDGKVTDQEVRDVDTTNQRLPQQRGAPITNTEHVDDGREIRSKKAFEKVERDIDAVANQELLNFGEGGNKAETDAETEATRQKLSPRKAEEDASNDTPTVIGGDVQNPNSPESVDGNAGNTVENATQSSGKQQQEPTEEDQQQPQAQEDQQKLQTQEDHKQPQSQEDKRLPLRQVQEQFQTQTDQVKVPIKPLTGEDCSTVRVTNLARVLDNRRKVSKEKMDKLQSLYDQNKSHNLNVHDWVIVLKAAKFDWPTEELNAAALAMKREAERYNDCVIEGEDAKQIGERVAKQIGGYAAL
eukprot:gnl/MRDRNA2_/MRDRNA2_131942_c0_seq1.p1 gnl/MRDRNA2_/MRDRNA2_131942_c0~~gnl/MRDRNA2_/MRDRNA2_131942_c0_seq1.p1  ORF type:complete len:355 (+),score=87.99 gnl/MRDRNA2_/MRDRNA2_131942_c0_seq1:99-1163(+)